MTDLGQTIRANQKGERALTAEPLYAGEPVIAVCAVDGAHGDRSDREDRNAVEQLAFSVDPIDWLRPGAADGARRRQRVDATRSEAWSATAATGHRRAEVDGAGSCRSLRRARCRWARKPIDEWSFGEVEAGFKAAALVLDETFVTPNTSHQTLEPRSAMAYWQNGKLYIHCSTQSAIQTVCVSRALDAHGADRHRAHQQLHRWWIRQQGDRDSFTSVIPALLSKKTNNAPVLMHIQPRRRAQTSAARVPRCTGRVKVGFSKEKKILALSTCRDWRERSVRAAGRRRRQAGLHRVVDVSARSDALPLRSAC